MGGESSEHCCRGPPSFTIAPKLDAENELAGHWPATRAASLVYRQIGESPYTSRRPVCEQQRGDQGGMLAMIRRLFWGGVWLVMIGGAGVTGLRMFCNSDLATQQAITQEILDLDSFQDLVRQEILEGMKSEYVSQHDWGHQTQTEKLHVRGKWYDPHVEKTTAEVNDGLWQRFVVSPVDPAENLLTRVEQIRTTEQGMAFVLTAQAKMTGRGQFERWKKGTRVYDISGDADVTVSARIACEVAVRREPGHLVDDVILDPHVSAIDLTLVDLEVKRIGKLGRDVARELGEAMRPTIAKELVRREPKMIERANVSIHKHPEKLRFSLDRFLASGWSKFETAVAGTPRDKQPQ
jgi:hypothetical protein